MPKATINRQTLEELRIELDYLENVGQLPEDIDYAWNQINQDEDEE